MDKSVEFSYEELAKATNDFSIDNKIGQGGFGSVYYAELRGEVCCSNTIIQFRFENKNYSKLHSIIMQKAAIKKMDMQASNEFLAELKVLTHVHHLNLVMLSPARYPSS